MQIDISQAPDWATECGKIGLRGQLVWSNGKAYQYLSGGDIYTFGGGNYWLNEYKVIAQFGVPPRQSVQTQSLLCGHTKPKSSIDYLDKVKSIQEERAAEYEQDGGERSFSKIASVFNTYTGKDLLPSDIALIFEILKNVRFYNQAGLHLDSVVDKISYASLWAELITEERT
jgi:5'-3' exonuclease